MGNLEHNIKEAFAAQDAKTNLADKDGMWNRLDSTMGRSKGVAALWRVAAILLGVFLITGAFAALNNSAKQQNAIAEMEVDNAHLLTTIDSLRLLPIATKTEIQVIEKEKLVYRDKIVVSQTSKLENYWEQKYKTLADSTELILVRNNKQIQEISRLGNELFEVKEKLGKQEQGLVRVTTNEQAAPFELKSGRVEVGVSKTPVGKNTDMKMKVFQKNFIENRNNLNSTIFKQ